MHLVIQEGGTSSELYPVLFDRLGDANAFRQDCTRTGSYRTTPPIKVPARLAKVIRADQKLEWWLVDLINAAVKSIGDLDLVLQD